MQEPGQKTEKPSVTAVWGKLHNQPDTSNIQQRLSVALKLLAMETESRENQGHNHKYSLSLGAVCLCVCVCFTLNTGTYP